MTKTELLAAARLTLDDTASPYLWSDAELTGYLHDAEQEAAERAGLIKVSGMPTYCNISIIAGTAAYVTNALVYEIEKARVSGESSQLSRTSREALDSISNTWEDETGTPTAYFLEENTITLYPKPTANGTLNMTVLRCPVTPMGASPEIGARHHRKMLDWVYRQAYLKRDADTHNEAESLKYERMFEMSFGPEKDAKTHTRHLEHRAIHIREAE